MPAGASITAQLLPPPSQPFFLCSHERWSWEDSLINLLETELPLCLISREPKLWVWSRWVPLYMRRRRGVAEQDQTCAPNHRVPEREELMTHHWQMASYPARYLAPKRSPGRLASYQQEPQYSKEDGQGELGKLKIKFVLLTFPCSQGWGNAKLGANRPAWVPPSEICGKRLLSLRVTYWLRQSFRGSSVLSQQGEVKAARKGDEIQVAVEKIRCRFRHQWWTGAEWPGVGSDQQTQKARSRLEGPLLPHSSEIT